MKFRFCGDIDCPDWLLAEISVLSKMSSVRTTLILRLLIQELLGNSLDLLKLNKLTTGARIALTAADIKALISALYYIITNSIKYTVNSTILLSELQQLGLPVDICIAIVKQYSIYTEQLLQYIKNNKILRLSPPIDNIHYSIDYILTNSFNSSSNNTSTNSSNSNNTKQPIIHLKLNQQQQQLQSSTSASSQSNNNNSNNPSASNSVQFSLTKSEFQLFYSDLLAAKQIMEGLK